MPGPLDRFLAGAEVVTGAAESTRGVRALSIAERVRTVLDLHDDVAVTVQQLTCREPGCPPVETVIAILANPARRWTLHRPLADVTDELVAHLLRDEPDGDAHDDH